MIELIIGATIALVSTVITSYIVHLFGSKRNSQSRIWQLEDLKKNELSELAKSRIRLIEEALDQARDAAVNIVNNEITLLVTARRATRKELFSILSSEDVAYVTSALTSVKRNDPKGFDNFSKDLEKLIDQKTEQLNTTKDAIARVSKLLPYVVSLDQGGLLTKIMELTNSLTNEESQFIRLSALISENEDFDEKSETVRVAEFLSNVTNLHGSIIEQLDIRRIA